MRTTGQPTSNVIPGPGAPTGSDDRAIGAILIDSGKITAEDAERVLRYSREHAIRFGDAAIALRLVTDNDIQQVLARQFDYAYLQPGQSDVSAEVVAAWAPFSPQVEALRALRSQLLLRWFTGEKDHKILTVISAARGDGRTHVAANLAVVFSQMGERTLIVDADLRNPRQHELFSIGNASGVSTLLAQRTCPESIQRVPGFVDLSVLPSGPIPPNPSELLGRTAFGMLCDTLAAQYDVVIVDTSAAALGSDYQLVANRAKGAAVVARKNHTPMDVCRSLADETRAAGAAVVGSVLNDY
jgi:protein-tyrosine kinase